MKPPISPTTAIQPDLFRVLLCNIISPTHPMVKLADSIHWDVFEKRLEPCFSDTGRQAKPVRLMVGLMYLKHTFNLSDEGLLAAWVENPYWQYFCGGVFFEHTAPLDSTSLTKWRTYLKEAGVEEMLAETIRTGLREEFLKPVDLQRVNVDTTVQEKNIRFPTSARLLDRARQRLVKLARACGIVLRQTYQRVGQRALRQQSAYARAQQFNRAAREERKLRTFLGRVVRDLERKGKAVCERLEEELAKARRILSQKKKDKDKLYSLHEPQVKCIAKGKAHKRYEFGCKVGLVTTARTNWVVGAQAFCDNPYDGHSLGRALEQTERLTGMAVRQAVCDLGYRGHGYEGTCDVQIVKRQRKKLSRTLRALWKRRSAIEPVIGHLKSEHGLDRNRLAGTQGDQLNAILSACGFNLRKLLRAFSFFVQFPVWMALFRGIVSDIQNSRQRNLVPHLL